MRAGSESQIPQRAGRVFWQQWKRKTQSHPCAFVQRLSLETALLVRPHSWTLSISVWFPSAISTVGCLLFPSDPHLIYSFVIYPFIIIFACNNHLIVFISPASCDLFTHHLPFLFRDSAPQWLLLLSGRMSPCAQSAEVLHWAPHRSCCFWCWVQGQFPHTRSCIFITGL